jgi:uncharacterized protein YjiS (DUF1127 family)
MSTSSLVFSNFSTSRVSADGCLGAGESGVVGLAAGRVRATVFAWASRCQRRHAALAIDDRTLADIGLNRGLVTLEAAKPFWRP